MSNNFLPQFITVNSIAAALNTNLRPLSPTNEYFSCYKLFNVEKGEAELVIEKKHFKINEGEFIIIPPFSNHSLFRKSTAQINVISFFSLSDPLKYISGRIFEITGKQMAFANDVIAIAKLNLKKVPTELGTQQLVPRKDAKIFNIQWMKNNLELLLIDIYKHNIEKEFVTSSNYENQDSLNFNALTDFLEKNLEKNLTLEDISKGCTISISKLNRLCHKKCNLSTLNYFIYLKIEMAKSLINNTNLNFTQISEKLGFSSVHYFSKLFKSRVNMSPTEYAKLKVALTTNT